jgi:ATP-dependent RNA helicase SUPV3L1/SUV3
MVEVGFARAGDAWKWRGRRHARPDRPGQNRANAFAELAKLKT